MTKIKMTKMKMTKMKMAKKIMITIAAAVFALSLAGCGTTETKSTAAPQQEVSTVSSGMEDPLSFVKSGEIYFDNQLGSSVKIVVDGNAMSGNTTAFKKGLTVSVEGLDPEGSVSYVIAYTKKDGAESRSAVVFSSGVDNSRVSESMTKALNMDMEKVCVCLYKSGETWNKNLSEGMNKLIEGYLPAER